VGGLTPVHQFVRIGKYAFICGAAASSVTFPLHQGGWQSAANLRHQFHRARAPRFSAESRALIKRIYKRSIAET
jgi:acyl-[acyl carrier protein]--UDP-N-acetylglucosamine O-acyltransferase